MMLGFAGAKPLTAPIRAVGTSVPGEAMADNDDPTGCGRR
jgi:hypothetical protein